MKKKKTEFQSLEFNKVLSTFNRTKRKIKTIRALIVGDKEELNVFLLHLLPINEPNPIISTLKVFILQHRTSFLGVDQGMHLHIMSRTDLFEKKRNKDFDFIILCFNFSVENSWLVFDGWLEFLQTNFPNEKRLLLGCASDRYGTRQREKVVRRCEQNRIEYWPCPSTFVNVVPFLVQRLFLEKMSKLKDWKGLPPLESLFPHLWVLEEVSVSPLHDLMSSLVREIAIGGGGAGVIETWSRSVLSRLKDEKISRKEVESGFNLFRLFSASFSWLYDYRIRNTESRGLVDKILMNIFGMFLQIYFLHAKPNQDMMYLFDHHIFWIPHSKFAFSTILCSLWKRYMKTISRGGKEQRMSISDLSQCSDDNEEFTGKFLENVDVMSDEIFELLLKSFFYEQKLRTRGVICGDEQRSCVHVVELLKLLVDEVFENYSREINTKLPKFLCQMFQYEGSLSSIGFDIVLYYFTKAEHPSKVIQLVEFLRVIVHHPFFIDYSRAKRHCISEIMMGLAEKYVIYMTYERMSKSQGINYERIISNTIELFYDHISLGLLKSGEEEEKEEKAEGASKKIEEDEGEEEEVQKEEEIISASTDEENVNKPQESNLLAMTFFPFVKKLFRKFDGIEIRLKLKESLKLAEIIICIFDNIPSTSLMEWFVSSGSTSSIGMNYWTEFLLTTFGRSSKQVSGIRESKRFFEQCRTTINTYRLYTQTVIVNDDTFFRIMRLTFQLLPLLHSECSKELFNYFVEFDFMEIMNGLKKHCFGFETRWVFIVNHVLSTMTTKARIQEQKESARYQKKVNILMIQVLKGLLTRYAITIDRRQPVRAFQLEEEVISKNILLNETLEHTLKAASLNKLVEYLVKSRSAMTEVFLTTHQLFVPTLELLNILITYYEMNRRKGNADILVNAFWLLRLFIKKFFFVFSNLEIAYLLMVLYKGISFPEVSFRFPRLSPVHAEHLKVVVLSCLSQTHNRIQPFDDDDDEDIDPSTLLEGNTPYGESDEEEEITDEEEEGGLEKESEHEHTMEQTTTSTSILSVVRSRKDSLKYSWMMLSASAEDSLRKNVLLNNLWYVGKYESIFPQKYKGGSKIEKLEKIVSKMKTWQELTEFIFRWDSEEIARQWVLLDFELFRRIPSIELVFRLHPQLGKSPSLDRLEARSKANCMWIQSAIISEKNPKKRLEITRKFVDILKNLKKFNNFVGIDCIVSSIETTPIERLLSPELNMKDTKTVMLLSPEEFDVIRKNSKVLSQNHGESLILSLDNVDVAIPVWKIYHNRLIHIEKINPEIYEMEYDGEPVKLINLNKQRLIYNILTQIKKFQQQTMYGRKINKVNSLYNALQRIASSSENYLGKSEVYNQSLVYKPKDVKSVRYLSRGSLFGRNSFKE